MAAAREKGEALYRAEVVVYVRAGSREGAELELQRLLGDPAVPAWEHRYGRARGEPPEGWLPAPQAEFMAGRTLERRRRAEEGPGPPRKPPQEASR
jgi:hypothetical protein